MRIKFKILGISILLPSLAFSYTTTTSSSLKVWFDDVALVADGQTVGYLKVYENDNIDYSAFNMTFNLPKGLKVHKIKKGRDMVDDIEMSARASSTHSIACNILEDGTTLKVISTSTFNDNFCPDDENNNPLDYLYRIGLVADNTMTPDTYTIEMTGIKFVLTSGDACIPADDKVHAGLTVTASTGIDEIELDKIDEICYDVQGQGITHPVRGMIIIYQGRKFVVK